MFVNNRKTIGFFICRTIDYFQQIMCKGIIGKATELGYNVAIFSSFGEYGQNEGFAKGEKEIIYLPEYEKLDGVIMALDTFDIRGMEEELLKNIRERSHCPVVSIRREIAGCYNVMIDDDVTMENMIRHFIVDHQFKRICFMSGPKGFIDGDRRLNCFKRLMKEYDLPVEDNQIFYGNFWSTMGKAACDHFFKDKDNVPEAIICANDYMAISVCNELFNRGIHIPQDISVCGFDGIRETDLYIPTITTVEVPFDEMGRISVEIINDVLAGKERDHKTYLQTKDHYKESCGCRKFDMIQQSKDQKDFFVRMDQIRQNNMQSTFMSIDLEQTTEFDQLIVNIAKYVNNNLDYKSFYLITCDDEEGDGKPYSIHNTFTSNMVLKMGVVDDEVVQDVEVTFPKEDLLPAKLASKEPMVYYFLPLHYNEHCFGYTAISFYNQKSYNEFYEPFLVNISNSLEAIYIQSELRRLLWEMEEMNVKDYLTGVLNRRGFEKYSKIFLERAKEEGLRVFVLGLDLDGMKVINDLYGHEEGDNALKVVSTALKESSKNREICARVGGDEFNVVGIDYTEEMADEYIQRFLCYMDRYNATSGKPYEVIASYGMYLSKTDENLSLEEYMRISDDRMYRQKNEKRIQRRL